MKILSKALFIASLVVNGISGAQESAHQPVDVSHRDFIQSIASVTLNLSDCIDRALREAIALTRIKNDLELNGAQLLQNYAQFYPSLQAGLNYNRTQGKALVATGVPSSIEYNNAATTYQISSSLNVFNGFADSSAINASLARKAMMEMSLERARQQIALDITQSYLQAILDGRIIEITQSNLAYSKARETLLIEQSRIGMKNIGDLYRQQAQTSQDETAFVNAQIRERNSKLLLIRKLRLDPSAEYRLLVPEIDVRDSGGVVDVDERKLVELALERRPDLRVAQLNAQAFNWDLKAARAGLLPKIDFGMSLVGTGRVLYSQTANGNDVKNTQFQTYEDQLGNNIVYTVGVSLTWNIFDRFLTRTNIQRVTVATKSNATDISELRNQVVVEVRQAYGEYQGARQQRDSSKKGLLAAQKAYEMIEGRYKLSISTFVDLLSAQAALIQAKAAAAQAQTSLMLQKRVLQAVTGERAN